MGFGSFFGVGALVNDIPGIGRELGPLTAGSSCSVARCCAKRGPFFRTLRLEIYVESLPEQQHSGFRGVELL